MEPSPGQPASNRHADVLPAITALALLVLAWLALSSTWARNEAVRERVTDEARAELRGHVSAWELGLQRALDDMVVDVRLAGDVEEVQGKLRRRVPWLDSVYVWTPSRVDFGGAHHDGAFVFPPRETDAFPDDPCVEPATAALINAPAALPECLGSAASTVLRTTNGAAEQLIRAGRADDAAMVLTRASFADLGPLAKWRSSTAMMAAVARHRALAAQAALIRGDPAAARKTVRDLATDTSTLSAPVLERVLPVVQQAVRVLTTANQDARDLRDLLTPAETRVDAWRALQHHPSHEPSKIASEGPRFLSHLHSDLPWAAYIVPPDAGGRGIALLLLPSRLHEDFLRVDAGRFNGAVAIVDPIGRPVAGARNAELAAETEVPFSLALRHEQVAFTRRTADGRIDPLLDTWWSWRNLVTLLSIVLGFGALAMLTNADRQRRELARRQREFTTRVTHELKTPLAGIKVMAENLAAGAFRDEDQREHMAQRIVSEADRLTARVNEILNLGREQVRVAHEPFDVEEIVLDAIDEWGPRYEEAGVQLLADVDPIDPVTGDARAIRDAIACLLDNALKYRREDVESQVWLDVRGEDDAVEILVTDNGIGVPAAERQRIFERFVRVEGPNRGKAGGHGLGLAQVAAIVQAHRGTVTCEDGVDGGARFRVRLPVTPAAR